MGAERRTLAARLPGLLRGYATVAEAIADRELVRALNDFWDLAERQLPHAAELDLAAYRTETFERFANPRMGYPLSRSPVTGWTSFATAWCR